MGVWCSMGSADEEEGYTAVSSSAGTWLIAASAASRKPVARMFGVGLSCFATLTADTSLSHLRGFYSRILARMRL